MARKHSECDSCTCGKVPLEYSDRGPIHVDLNDFDEVAGAVYYCVMDHHYDRPSDGIPYGLPTDMNARIAKALNDFLASRFPNWKNETIFIEDRKADDAFEADLRAVIKAACEVPNAD